MTTTHRTAARATWTEAERTGDADPLDALLADDFVGIGPVGFVLDQPAWLGRSDRGLRYDELALDEVDASTATATPPSSSPASAPSARPRGNPTPPDTRVSFTVVADDDELRIAGMQYSFIGPPMGAPA